MLSGYLPAAVPGDPPPLEPPPLEPLPLLELRLPPQLTRIRRPSSTQEMRAGEEPDAAVRIEPFRRSTAKGSRIPANIIPPVVQGVETLAVAAVVLIVSVSVTALPFTVAVVGENVQAALQMEAPPARRLPPWARMDTLER